MMRKWVGAFLLLTGLALCGCQGFNPQTSEMTQKNQCIAIQRQMLFGNDMSSSNTTAWQTTNERLDLQKQFNQMHCNNVLQGIPTPTSGNVKQPVTG